MPSKGQFTDADLAQPTIDNTGADTTASEPSLLQTVMHGAGDLGMGALKGAGSTANAIGKVLVPDVALRAFGMHVPTKEQEQGVFAPANTTQAVGKGIEQAGEFMVPGAAEEEGANALLKAFPAAEKAAPLVKVLVSGASSGLVNKAQGGGFGQGFATGAATSGIGSGLRAVAPKLAESALGITKADRAFEKAPGEAALKETKALSPHAIATQARGKTNDELMPQLEKIADAASQRPTPRIAGFLPPPAEEVPLANISGARNPRMRPMAFPAQINPEETMEPRSGNPFAPISEYPGVNPHYLSGSEHSELAGRTAQPGGVFLRSPEMSASIPPAFEPNPMVSLSGAREAISGPLAKAFNQEAGPLHGQLSDMADFLERGRVSGEPLPEIVTPRRALDLKRGFGDTFLRWNPETHEAAEAAGRNAYRALDKAFESAVPGSEEINQRISSLIPVARRAESTARNAGTTQNIFHRLKNPTGALIGSAFGAQQGYEHGGVPGAVGGGIVGLTAPILLSTPEAQMGLARGMYSPWTGRVLRAAVTPAVRKITKQSKEKEGQSQ